MYNINRKREIYSYPYDSWQYILAIPVIHPCDSSGIARNLIFLRFLYFWVFWPKTMEPIRSISPTDKDLTTEHTFSIDYWSFWHHPVSIIVRFSNLFELSSPVRPSTFRSSFLDQGQRERSEQCQCKCKWPHRRVPQLRAQSGLVSKSIIFNYLTVPWDLCVY